MPTGRKERQCPGNWQSGVSTKRRLRCYGQESFCDWKQRHCRRRRYPGSGLAPHSPALCFPGCGAPAGPLRGREAGVQLRPPLPPRGRQDARGCMRARSAGRGCRVAGIRPGGQAGSDHGHGAPSHPVSSIPVPRATRGGGARLLPPPPRGGSERPVAAAALRITGHIIAGAARFRACSVAAALT